ncbi:hypothetical protein ACFLYV_05320 [Chloroflexota bacterium]
MILAITSPKPVPTIAPDQGLPDAPQHEPPSESELGLLRLAYQPRKPQMIALSARIMYEGIPIL